MELRTGTGTPTGYILDNYISLYVISRQPRRDLSKDRKDVSTAN
ncbi:MAG: hypothetical protein WBF33_07700 [Candidatus Nitrosopolaris sp.]